MLDLIEKFTEQVSAGDTEVYNEFSLQHELGCYLRSHLDARKVQFERNVSYFGLSGTGFEKREIDISIYGPEQSNCVAIELKYPRNGMYPEQMFSFCKDIMFLEQLLESGFKKAMLLIFADDHLFYSGNPKEIYAYFRCQKPITGTICKPTGKKDQKLIIRGEYTAKWYPAKDPLKYCLIDVQLPETGQSSS